MTHKMYPVDELEELKDLPKVNDGGLQFRLKHITDLQKFLESEVDNYSRCKRKYSYTIKVISSIKTTCDVVVS